MSDDINNGNDKDFRDDEELQQQDEELVSNEHSDYTPADRFDASAVHHLSGMYKNWFLDYASYVILERAVPHIEDGLKPVQRRILHTMKRMDDGRYNKVANVVGETMKFHPHGTHQLAMRWCNWGRKICLSTRRETGEISLRATRLRLRDTSRRVSRSSPSTSFSTRKLRNAI